MRVQAVELESPEKAQAVRDINRASDRGFLTREETAEAMAEILGIEASVIIAEQNEREVRNEALVELAQSLRPQYKVAMLSNVSGRDRLEIRFNKGQLDQLFDTVVASGDEGSIKPEPEIYEIVAERLGVLPSECVMIDDIREFCEGAERVGMTAIQFISTEQCITDLKALIDRGDKTV